MDGQRQLFEIIRGQIGSYRLVDAVCSVLNISDDAAYRRIRGDKELTYMELKKLTQAFSVSLDKIMEVNEFYRAMPFQYHNQDYFVLSDVDLNMSKNYVEALKTVVKNPYSEFGFAYNTVLLHTRVLYEPIFRYYVLKWMYQYGGPDKAIPFSKIEVPPALKDHHMQYIQLIKKIKYTYVIFQEYYLMNVVRDIQYFRDTRLLLDEDVALLKECIAESLHIMEKLIIDGAYDTGCKIDFYVSGLSLEASYTYLLSEKMYISMVDAFSVGAITSLDEEAGKMMIKWIQSLKRTSTLLTGSEKNRLRYMDEQWKILGKL